MNTYESLRQYHSYIKERLEQPLTVASIEEILVILQQLGPNDPEAAHSYEDQLYKAVLKQLDDPIAKAALNCKLIAFPRWFG